MVTLDAAPSSDVIRMNFNHAVVLQFDGKNFLSWKTMVPGYLQALPWAWQATNGELRPDATGKDKEHFDIGNTNARTCFMNVTDPTLFLEEFFHDSPIVTAADIWTRLKKRFHNETGLYREQATYSWLAFEWSSSKSLDENILAYKQLTFNLVESNAGIPANTLCSKLLTSLPPDWSGFKSAWSTRDESEKTFTTLVDLIRSEAARRETENPESPEVTALVTRVGNVRRQQYQNQRYTNTNRSQATSRTRTVIECWTCGKRGHKAANCRAAPQAQQQSQPQRDNRRGGRQQDPTANFSEVFMCDAVSDGVKDDTSMSTRVVVDSGSNHNVLNNPEFFDSLEPLRTSREVRLANSTCLKAQGQGAATLIVRQGESLVKMRLKNALLVSGMNTNLISVSQMAADGYKVAFKENSITLSQGRVKARAPLQDGLFVLEVLKPAAINTLQTASTTPPVSVKIAHEILAHVDKKKVMESLKLAGIPYTDDLVQCEACLKGKQHRQPSRSKPMDSRADKPGFIHSDTCAATETSISGNRYFLCLIDDFSRYRCVFFLKQKDQVADCI